MFKTGDYLVYGTNGVCKVEAVGPMESPGGTNDRIYYTLCPCYTKGSRIYTPTDNQKVVIRPVLSKDDVVELVKSMDSIEDLWVPDEKKRENDYKEAFRKCDCRELIRIIKTTHNRKQTRAAEGKKVTFADEKYFRMAEDSLYGELAVALGVDKDAAREYVLANAEPS